jgi:hypothetical protein
MRFLLVFMMCFALAFQGIAGTLVFQPPCAMQHDMATADDAVDCCNDADTQVDTGQMCKTGQACPVPSVTGATSLHIPAPAPAASALPASALAFVLSTDPSGVWRPPLFL